MSVDQSRAYAIDLHVHIDERVDYRKIPSALKMWKLDGAGIVAHNDLTFAQKVTKFLQKNDPKRFYFSGTEIDTSAGHILAFGIQEEIPQGLTPEKTIEMIRKRGGVSIIPHPFMSNNSIGWKAVSLSPDAMEFYNGFAKIFLNFPNRMAEVAFRSNGFGKVGGSDAHYAYAVGSCYTLVKITGKISEQKVLEAIRNHQTKPMNRPINRYDISNFIKIVFTPKEGRKVVRVLGKKYS
jgi:hypothetical protein